jgi:hypothetical protein
MKSWSSVEVQSESPGDYILKIISDDKKLISSKTFSISNQKKAVFKYNFGNFKKGIYTFQLLKNEKIIYSKKYTKK